MTNNPLVKIILFVIIVIILTLINCFVLFLSKKLDYSEKDKVYHKNVVIWGILLPVAIYLLLNFLSFSGKQFAEPGMNFSVQNLIIERIFAFLVTISFFLIKIYFSYDKNKKIKNHFPYSRIDDEYYVDIHYKNISKDLKIASYIICGILILVESIFVYNNIFLWTSIKAKGSGLIGFIGNYSYILNVWMIYLIVYELSAFLNGKLLEVSDNTEVVKNRQDLFSDMLNEYKTKFSNNLILTYAKDDNAINSTNENDDYIYSKIFTPIIEEKNIIIETENLSMLKDVIPPIINLIFATNRKIVFLTESDDETQATYNWLRMMGVITDNSKIVVELLLEGNDRMIVNDTNIDICIGTVDLLIENRDIINNVDVIFSINIDNIIVSRSINLSIMTKILSESKNKSIQYVLFANELNGLQQAIEGIFYSQDFNYQVVRSQYTKNFHAMIYAKDKGSIQKNILPAVAKVAIGDELPLLIPAVKYDFHNLYAFSAVEPYDDEMRMLHVNIPNLKIYLENKILNVENDIQFFMNEHFVDNDDSMVVVYDDSENNLVLILKNYLKYANSRILVNIVTDKYLLRDYMIDNLDFLLQNNEFVGKIVPIHKDGNKLLLFKLINELMLKTIDEEDLVLQLCRISNKTFDLTDTKSIENFIRTELTYLIKEIFNVSLYIDTYLNKELNTRKAQKAIYSYHLIDDIKNELPNSLFKIIKFVASDQKAKILKRIPLYEMYQNYAIGQYVVFSGKSYIIDL